MIKSSITYRISRNAYLFDLNFCVRFLPFCSLGGSLPFGHSRTGCGSPSHRGSFDLDEKSGQRLAAYAWSKLRFAQSRDRDIEKLAEKRAESDLDRRRGCRLWKWRRLPRSMVSVRSLWRRRKVELSQRGDRCMTLEMGVSCSVSRPVRLQQRAALQSHCRW